MVLNIRASHARSLAWALLFLVSTQLMYAQMLADFETPGTSPLFTASDSIAVVANPDKTGINTSDSVGYYKKITGNWKFVVLHFPDTMKIRLNNKLKFKLRTSVQGRIFAKFYLGNTYFIEDWCPDWNFLSPPNAWVECEMDITDARGKVFTALHLATCVDIDTITPADVWFDDVQLINTEAGEGIPQVHFSVSKQKVIIGEDISYDASESWDYGGEIISYLWDFGDGTVDSGIVVTHSYTMDSVFHPVLTVTDNDSNSSSCSLPVYVFPAGGKLSMPVFPGGEFRTNEKIEVTFQVMDQYENPYDPDEVMIGAEVSCPDGSVLRVPCFYYESATYQGGVFKVDGREKTWMLRFISEQEGSHSLKLMLTDTSGEYETGAYGFEVSSGDAPGIIRPDTNNHQYYRHSTGEPFYPLGINIGWETTIASYTTIINNLSQGRANIFRYWHTPFRYQALEWDEDYYYDYEGLGRYNQSPAAMTDSLLDLCEAVDMTMQLAIFQHGEFSENVDQMWASNPYNSANGGLVERAEEFFYNDACKAQVKKLLRYIVARWGYSRNLFAWEFFNEVQFTGIHNSQSGAWESGVIHWHAEMSHFIDSIDAFNHIMTTSASNEQILQLDNIPTLDNLQYHIYEGDILLLEKQAELDNYFRNQLDHASIINGEYGIRDNQEADTPFDMQRNAIWNGIMTQVPRYMWTWSHYTQQSWANLFSMPAGYLAGEEFSREDSLRTYGVVRAHPDVDLDAYCLTTGDKYYGYIYDPDYATGITGATVVIEDLPVAVYDLEYFLPVSGEIVREDSIAPVFDDNVFTLPTFDRSVAFKLKYREEYTAPFARAGNDTVVPVGGTAHLSGVTSSSEVTDVLSYLWRIVEKPDSSGLELTDSTGMTIDIAPDVTGTYILSLVVNDGSLDSRPDEVRVRMSAPPVAVAPADTVVYLGNEYVRLSGGGSYDPDGEPLTYRWVLLSVPPGSDSLLMGGEESGLTTLYADTTGVYLIQLVVNDGYQSSCPDTFSVTVLDATGLAEAGSPPAFRVYPNPAAGSVFISVPGGGEIERIELFDMQGRLISQPAYREGARGEYEVSLGDLLPEGGTVILRITGTPGTGYHRLILLKD